MCFNTRSPHLRDASMPRNGFSRGCRCRPCIARLRHSGRPRRSGSRPEQRHGLARAWPQGRALEPLRRPRLCTRPCLHSRPWRNRSGGPPARRGPSAQREPRAKPPRWTCMPPCWRCQLSSNHSDAQRPVLPQAPSPGPPPPSCTRPCSRCPPSNSRNSGPRPALPRKQFQSR